MITSAPIPLRWLGPRGRPAVAHVSADQFNPGKTAFAVDAAAGLRCASARAGRYRHGAGAQAQPPPVMSPDAIARWATCYKARRRRRR